MLGTQDVPLARAYARPAGGAKIELGIRPEFIRLSSNGRGMPGRVVRVDDVGRYRVVKLDLDGHLFNAIADEDARDRRRRSRQHRVRSRPTSTSTPTAGWSKASRFRRERHDGQDLEQPRLVHGAAGADPGGVQRHHPADDGGELLGAGDVRRQRLLLPRRRMVRGRAAFGAFPRRAAVAS